MLCWTGRRPSAFGLHGGEVGWAETTSLMRLVLDLCELLRRSFLARTFSRGNFGRQRLGRPRLFRGNGKLPV